MQKTPNKKYPKSKEGYQCLGPCYNKGTRIMHPITLNYMTTHVHPFCPVFVPDPKNADQKIGMDECYIPTDKADMFNNETASRFLSPEIPFDKKQFLAIYYDINSFEKAISWIDTNKNKNIHTKLRIMECAFGAYKDDILEEFIDYIDGRLIEFYKTVIKTLWLKDIYPVVNNYLFINKKGEIYIDNKMGSGKHTNKVERINYFLDAYANDNIVYKYISTFFKTYRGSWDDVQSYNDLLKKTIIKYIITKIKNTLL
jgi:hypothetical protein